MLASREQNSEAGWITVYMSWQNWSLLYNHQASVLPVRYGICYISLRPQVTCRLGLRMRCNADICRTHVSSQPLNTPHHTWGGLASTMDESHEELRRVSSTAAPFFRSLVHSRLKCNTTPAAHCSTPQLFNLN